ncbi:MAG: histidine kinase [Blastocatellia bacterium]|nr:histidine kinase [Blastocatellia bacterium]
MSPQAVALMLTFWILSVIIYPTLVQASDWFVDKVILQRTNYETLKIEIAKIVNRHETIELLLQSVCKKLAQAFTASEVRVLTSHSSHSVCDVAVPHSHENQELTFQIVMTDFATKFSSISAFENSENGITTDRSQTVTATVFVPTTEHPHYLLVIGELGAGRRLLSDDITILEAIALLIARRIDALRVNHERCERSLREQQMSKLATEAELRALRAQINPHFLFNALTTIGYLIQTTPNRAFDTLMRLTGLLRAVLRRSSGEFVTLGEEIDLIESYLEIEHARFEERLRTHIKVPEKLRSLRIPTLLIQPLVENAIKHGIGPKREGGDVTVGAEIGKEGFLQISVTDTGAGVSEIELARQRKRGVGLANVEQRLKGHYGEVASMLFESASGKGTKVQLTLPLNSVEISEDFKKSLIKGV